MERNSITLPVGSFIAMGVIVVVILSSAILVTAAVNSETRSLGRCIVQQMSEHRQDNREVQEALAKQHNNFVDRQAELPITSEIIPMPKEDLSVFCKPFLDSP